METTAIMPSAMDPIAARIERITSVCVPKDRDRTWSCCLSVVFSLFFAIFSFKTVFLVIFTRCEKILEKAGNILKRVVFFYWSRKCFDEFKIKRTWLTLWDVVLVALGLILCAHPEFDLDEGLLSVRDLLAKCHLEVRVLLGAGNGAGDGSV